MSNFKIGQKVVFIGSKTPSPECIYPELNEMVTVKGHCLCHTGALDILEYPVTKDGYLQSLASYLFRPLNEDFATETLARITKQVKEEQLTTTL